MENNSKKEMGNRIQVDEGNVPLLKKFRATLCHHCPFCRHARKSPESTIGKILHHKYHAENCPLWKAEKEVYGEHQRVDPAIVKSHLIWKEF